MADYQKMQENIALICERVSMGERMAMLAEETAELADAARLLRESITESRRKGRKFTFGREASEEVAEDWKQGEPNGLETGAGGWNFKSFRRTAAFDVERHTAAVAACGRCAQNGAEAGTMGEAAERRDRRWE